MKPSQVGCLSVFGLVVLIGSASFFFGNNKTATTQILAPGLTVSEKPLTSALTAAEKWETITGVQQGVKLAMDIDDNSIQKTPDGASSSVTVRINADDIERITYICRSPSSGVPGAVIFNGQVTDLAAGSTGDAIMRRVCFGPTVDAKPDTLTLSASSDPSDTSENTAASDPYAAGQHVLGEQEYAQSKTELLDRVRVAYFAAGCRVIQEVEVQMIFLSGIHRISDDDIHAGRSDYHPDLLPAARIAATEGLMRAKQSGSCNYWLQNPDAVAEIRQQAQLATMP